MEAQDRKFNIQLHANLKFDTGLVKSQALVVRGTTKESGYDERNYLTRRTMKDLFYTIDFAETRRHIRYAIPFNILV
jgi:hypothetical protein